MNIEKVIHALRVCAIVVGCLVIATELFAKNKKNPTYVSVGFHNPSLDLAFDNQGASTSESVETNRLHYVPRDPLVISLGGSYAGFSGSLSADIPADDDEEALDYSDYRLSYLGEALGIDGQYTSFKRFYLDEVEGLDLEQIDDAARFREDLEVQAISLNTYWFPLAWRWNLDIAFDPAREDKQTGVGFGLVGTYSSMDIDANRALVPNGFQEGFGLEGGIESGQFKALSGQIAAGATLSIWRLYLSGLVAFGQGYQSLDYDSGDRNVTSIGIADSMLMHLIAGYSGPRVFLSLEYREDTPVFLMKTVSLSSSRSEMIAKLGWKF